MRRSPLIVAALVLASGAALSCRGARKGVRVGSEAATLEVKMTSLQPEDRNRKEWIYELYAGAEGGEGEERCPASLTGTLAPEDKVIFTAQGLKRGLKGCQFRVKTLEGTLPAGVAPIADSEPGVLYWAKDLVISQDARGALVATAGLQQLFQVIPSPDARHGFTLTVPVTFSIPETRPHVTANLNCTPGTGAIGVLPTDAAAARAFTFYIAIDRAVNFTCTDIAVSVDGHNNVYTGVFPGQSGSILADVDGKLTVGESIALKLMGELPPDDTGVHVNVDEGDCTAAGKIYDRATKQCIDRPASTPTPTPTATP